MATAVLKDPTLTGTVIRGFEGTNLNAYWDVNGWAIGNGVHQLYDPATGAMTPVTQGMTIDSATAQVQMDYQIQNVYAPGIANRMGIDTWNSLTPEQQAAYTSLAYNYGPNSSCLDPAIVAAQSGDSNAMAAATANLSANPSRRAQEAAMMNGQLPQGAQAGGAPTALGANKNPGAGGTGAGCAGGALGMVAAIAGGGLMSGLGMALNGALSGLTGALGLSGITGALSGVMGQASGLLNGALSGVTGALSGGIGGALSGLTGGIGGALSGLTGGLGSALGGITGGIGNALNSLSGGAFQALSQMGSGILPSLTGVLPAELTGIANGALAGGLIGGLKGGLSGMINGAVGGAIGGTVGSILKPLSGVLQNSVGFPNAIQQFAAHGGLTGMINTVGNNMVGKTTTGGLGNFMNNIGMAAGMAGLANNIVGGVSEASALRFGTGVGGLGGNYRNNNDVLSYGLTSLSRNLPGAANDMLNLGSFGTQDLLRLQQPGSVAKQIICAGLGDTTGLTRKIISAGIPVGGVDSPLYDDQVQGILSTINDPSALGAVSSHFNIRKPIDHLGHLTDFKHMCPTLAATSPNKNFSELGHHFNSLGITNAKSFQDIGETFSKVDAGIDLNHYSQMSTPFHPAAANTLIQTFGYGGGSLGEVTMADFIGTAAGYVHTDTIPHIIHANNVVGATPEGQELQRRIGMIHNLINGQYHVPGQPAGQNGEPATQDCIVIRDNVPSYDGLGNPTKDGFGNVIPGSTLSRITTGNSLGSGTPSALHGQVYYSMDSAMLDLVSHVEDQLQVVKNHPDPEVQKALAASEKAHAASCAQIIKENHMITTYGMDLFSQHTSNAPLNAYVFADSLKYHGQNTNYGQAGHYIERVASDDIYGDSIKAAMRMGRNEAAVRDLGINTDRFKVPHSDYYRDPQSFYMDSYTGNMPLVPSNLMDQVLPTTPADTYVELRNQTLDNNGYDFTQMLPAQADETYYDLQWRECNADVKESLGLSLVGEAINRNVTIVGNKMNIINLNGSRTLVGVINDDGLSLINNDIFLKSLLDILNKMIYGNIGATKYDNPFDTDQMIHGFHELLNQVTPSNIDALAATRLGSAVGDKLLNNIKQVFMLLMSSGDTGLDRNNVSAWGGAGPDGETIIPPQKIK
jgi:GH24 family phage-related lysozyme (muramidase)